MALMHSAGSETGGRLSRFLAGGLRQTGLLFGIYFALSIVMRLVLPDGLTLDEAEQSLSSQHWLLGYGPQPPFYNWVQSAVVSVLGLSLLSLALPKFLMLLLCYLFYGMAAREMTTRPVLVALAMLSLLALPQVSYMPQQDLTHTVAVLMAVSLFLYGLCRTLARPDWQGYALLGLAIGIGTLSKYNFILLPVATLLAVFCEASWRPRLFDRRFLLTILIALVIVLPHAFWLRDHVDLATGGTISKMVEAHAPHGVARLAKALLSLLVACMAFGALVVVVFAAALRSSVSQAWRASDEWTRLFGRIMLFSLGLVVLVILVAGTTKITERWLDPYLLPLPLYLLLKFEKAGAGLERLLPRLLPFFLLIMVVALLPQPAKTWSAALTGSYGRLNMPFRSAADRLGAARRPALVLAQGMHMAGNMRLQFRDVPVMDTNDLAEGKAAVERGVKPILVVWVPGEGKPSEPMPDLAALVAQSGLTQSSAGTLELPYRFGRSGAPLWKLSYAWLD